MVEVLSKEEVKERDSMATVAKKPETQENLTKELQDAINHYLSLLSDGQFQIRFPLDKEKLNKTTQMML